MLNIFHTHKWSTVKNRQQICKSCKMVRIVECPHVWKTVGHQDVVGINNNKRSKSIDILCCKKCGDKKQFVISV